MAEQRKVSYPKRGKVYLVNFEPTLGAEINKTRPASVAFRFPIVADIREKRFMPETHFFQKNGFLILDF